MSRPRVSMSTLRRAAWERAEGRCEVSGVSLGPVDGPWELHHRRNKGMGGTVRPDTDTLPNLLALDARVHNGGPTSVHGRRGWSEERGYLVPKNVDQVAPWPVLLRGRRWVLLTASGLYRPVPA